MPNKENISGFHEENNITFFNISLCWLSVAFAWVLLSNFCQNSPSCTKLEFPQSLRVKGRRCLTFCDPQTRDQSGFQEQSFPPGDLLESWVWVKMLLIKKAALQHNLSAASAAPMAFLVGNILRIKLLFHVHCLRQHLKPQVFQT